MSGSPEGQPPGPTVGGVVVFDLEYTAWEGSQARGWSGRGEYREIVQIGAVRLETCHSWPEIASLSCLVQPRINPQLSEYFTELTGITQAQLDAQGVSFAEGLSALAELGPAVGFWSNGPDGDVITQNCLLTGTVPLLHPQQLLDVRPFLARTLKRPAHEIDSFRLAKQFCERPGRAHDALADARGVAAALRHAICASG